MCIASARRWAGVRGEQHPEAFQASSRSARALSAGSFTRLTVGSSASSNSRPAMRGWIGSWDDAGVPGRAFTCEARGLDGRDFFFGNMAERFWISKAR